MTRQEFIETINDFYDLREFCDENRLCACENIMSDDTLDEEINYRLENYRDYFSNWREARDFLSDIDTSYYWYDMDFNGIDYDFDEYKERALEEGDDDGIWDDEEEDEEEEEEAEEVEGPDAGVGDESPNVEIYWSLMQAG